MDQTPLSASRRSTVGSYMDILGHLREVFADSKLSRQRGFNSGHFSFNSPKGQCPQCEGRGTEDIEMHFISDVSLICEVCQGRRYRQSILEVHYQGKNIAEVLDLTVEQAYAFLRA